MAKNPTPAPARAASVTSPTDRGAGISETVIAADGDSPDANSGDQDRSQAGEARTGNTAPSAAVTTAASLDPSPAADIAPATEFDPSGAPIQTTDIDVSHVAVDNNPRANTTVDQNRIDFNDPVRTGAEIVTDQLKAQSAS